MGNQHIILSTTILCARAKFNFKLLLNGSHEVEVDVTLSLLQKSLQLSLLLCLVAVCSLNMSSFTSPSSAANAVFELLSKETKSDKATAKATNADSNITATVVSMVQKEPKIVGDVLRKLVEMVLFLHTVFLFCGNVT
jgi:hypothetical protein